MCVGEDGAEANQIELWRYTCSGDPIEEATVLECEGPPGVAETQQEEQLQE